jgi:hypothetical protein
VGHPVNPIRILKNSYRNTLVTFQTFSYAETVPYNTEVKADVYAI